MLSCVILIHGALDPWRASFLCVSLSMCLLNGGVAPAVHLQVMNLATSVKQRGTVDHQLYTDFQHIWNGLGGWPYTRGGFCQWHDLEVI